MLSTALAGGATVLGTGVQTARNSKACQECATEVKSAAWGAGKQFARDTIGGLAKRARGSLMSFFGSGYYELVSNSLVDGGGKVSSDNIRIVPAGNREVRIMYREYLGDVTAAAMGVFNVQSYTINPGLPQTFPWLSNISSSFDQYTLNGCLFEFKTTSSDYTSNQALGSVIMATEYDVVDGPYTNKTDMLNSAYAQEAKPSISALHGIECAINDTPTTVKFTRDDSLVLPSSYDARDYDWGIFCIATQGGTQTADVTVGSLYIHYDITFRKEQVPKNIFINSWTAVQYTGVNFTHPTLFGSTTIVTPLRSGNNAPFIDGVAKQVNFTPALPDGSYWVLCCSILNVPSVGGGTPNTGTDFGVTVSGGGTTLFDVKNRFDDTVFSQYQFYIHFQAGSGTTTLTFTNGLWDAGPAWSGAIVKLAAVRVSPDFNL